MRRWSVRHACADIRKVDVPVDRTLEGKSSWLRVVWLKSADKAEDAA